MESVSGGGIFSHYDDWEYQQAGVDVVGPGTFWNDGYKFQGKTISTLDAIYLVDFYQANGRVASSVQEANDWWYSVHPDEIKTY